MKSLLNAGDILSVQNTDYTIVPAQQVHNSWCDRWIELKFLQEFAEAFFPGVDKISLLDADGVSSGQTTNQTRIPGQQVQNSWSSRWIEVKFIQEFLKALFSLASQWNRFSTPPTSGQAIPSTRPKYRLQTSVTLYLTVGSCSIFYRSFRRLFSFVSQWNRNESATVSGLPRVEYQLKRSITLDPTVESSSNFYISFWRLFS